MKICLVCDAGGHLTELLELIDAFNSHQIFLVTFRDVFTANFPNAYLLKEQKSFILNILVYMFELLVIFIKEKPDVIASTGSYIAIPAFFLGKFFFRVRLIFVESVAQVTSPSLTGRIVYPIAHLFFVQWESLLDKYGKKAQYFGGLI